MTYNKDSEAGDTNMLQRKAEAPSLLLLLRPPVLCPSIDIFLDKGQGGQLPTSTDSAEEFPRLATI